MVRYSLATGLLSLSLSLLAQAIQRSPVPISVLRKQAEASKLAHAVYAQQVELAETYPAYNISTPIDHFHNDSLYEPHSDGFYNMRYWFDAQYYKEGGPVIVLASGETSGTDRLPYLQQGIVAQLAQATNGIGVVLEHRYYGQSWPVPNLSTENLRFLTTDQALADTAYFAQNVKFEGLEDVDLSSNTTAYIAYGGSYAGAFVAILRTLYPDIYWGAISSSGVTEAIYDYWQYYEAAAIYGPPACIDTTRKVTNVVDNILIGKNRTQYVTKLKKAFGLSGVTDDGDFASAISGGISGLQDYNWDPTQGDDSFFVYCDKVSSDAVQYPKLESLRSTVEELISVGGWGNETETLTNRTLNYIGYVRGTAVASCEGDQNECFGTSDPEFYALAGPDQTWKSWPYQYCTQ
ncbi:serine carboxypeptidase S28-domain-containing protein [Xylariales sp. AK1849]|nr:serine carboxypeptidase S28-domain-containing protein [Xylariales sp. AK1849]